MNDLSGQVVVVTGAARGVGRGLAEALADAGAHVVLAVRDQRAGDELAATLSTPSVAVRCDVTVDTDIEHLFDEAAGRWGRIDHVVHNAASGRSSEVGDLSEADLRLWEEHAAVSLRALYRLARAGAEPLASSRGSLLVLTSPAGIEGSDTVPLYAAVKGGQRGFVRALAREWGPAGVRVNAIAPLAMSPALMNAFVENPTLQARLESATPLGRVGDPRTDIGPVAVFLCSSAAGYVTGQTVVVSGGRFTLL